MSAATPLIIVIIGVGGIGSAIAQRIGSGRLLLLADSSQANLDEASTHLELRGHRTKTQAVDISNASSLEKLANFASSLGHIHTVIHAAGVSPVASSAAQIYTIDLVGTANVIDAFQPVMTPGSSLLCVASMAGHLVDLPPAEQSHLSTAPTSRLVECPSIDANSDDSSKAYSISKLANILRVRASARSYGEKGARINSISPGIISTALGREELAGETGAFIRRTIETCPARRIGTVDDVAEAAAFMTGPNASFMTGTDLLIDGGASGIMKEAIEQRRRAAAAEPEAAA
ncbi:Hypothetical predicted protein [Lecanosticta acicola]|uniref:Uncharacterized protein n=1 Tax=Lecanosticta acicola TaxID=111012 RepID=A0AAI9E5A9_9PEZI|nr:Hypothetical predicted protein [Lecanosticta acicola]